MEGEDYLSTPIVRPSGDFDILRWWQQNRGHYPRLAQVAKDILSVPITGVGVERVFNVTKDIINDRRHRLNAETIRRLTIMRDRYQQTLSPEQMDGADISVEGSNLTQPDDLYTLPPGEGSLSTEDSHSSPTNESDVEDLLDGPPDKRRRIGP